VTDHREAAALLGTMIQQALDDYEDGGTPKLWRELSRTWRKQTGLADPLQARHLAVAVEAMGAGEDGFVAGEALTGTNDGHAGADRPFADHERSFSPHDGCVPDAHALDVSDRVVGTGR
jgi:hypothetical protein